MDKADTSNKHKTGRLSSLLLVLLLHAAAIWGLINALGMDMSSVSRPVQEALISLNLSAPDPKSEPTSIKADEKAAGAEGESSSANKQAKATPVIAPKLDKPPPTQNKVKSAEKPRKGRDRNSGLADKNDGGQAAGGAGDGTGTGNNGAGTGGGGKGNGAGSGFTPQPPSLRQGNNLTEAQYRSATGYSKKSGRVDGIVTVTADGRAINCRITKPSGNPQRDALSCQHIEATWRYWPASGEDGKPKAAEATWWQKWFPK